MLSVHGAILTVQFQKIGRKYICRVGDEELTSNTLSGLLDKLADILEPKTALVKEEISKIIAAWDQASIVKHRHDYYKRDDVRRKINSALKKYSADEIISAIKTYAEIVNSPDFWFNYKWAFKDFLQRGIDKFVDREIAISNYATDYRKAKNQIEEWVNGG